MIANVATVTREEAQDLLRASDRTLRRLVETGAIRAIDGPRGERLLDRDDVMRCARARDAAITQDEAASLLGISVTSVGRMVRSGRLDSVATPGGKRRILRASVEAEIAARGTVAETRHESARTRQPDDESDRTRHDGFVTGQDTSPGAALPCGDGTGDDDADDDPDAAYVPLDADLPVQVPAPPRARRTPVRLRTMIGGLAAAAAIAAAVFALTLEREPASGQASPQTVPAASVPARSLASEPDATEATPVTPRAVQLVAVLEPAPTRHPAKTRHAPAKPKKKRPATKPKPAAVAPTPSQTETPPADSGSDEASSGASDGGSDAGASGSSGGSDAGSACHDIYGSVGIC